MLRDWSRHFRQIARTGNPQSWKRARIICLDRAIPAQSRSGSGLLQRRLPSHSYPRTRGGRGLHLAFVASRWHLFSVGKQSLESGCTLCNVAYSFRSRCHHALPSGSVSFTEKCRIRSPAKRFPLLFSQATEMAALDLALPLGIAAGRAVSRAGSQALLTDNNISLEIEAGAGSAGLATFRRKN